jgi:adenylate cyclase
MLMSSTKESNSLASESCSARGYELEERIGKGGFGLVYRASQPSVGRQVAVKMILPHYAGQEEFVKRFDNEARLVARLEHPHIVPLFDYWQAEDGAYLVMRWLDGGNLYESLKRKPWDVDSAADLLDQLAGALSIAHENDVIHRDVKPENILLDRSGNAYLTDFGIAKDLIDEMVTTESGIVMGSLLYISPEHVQGKTLTSLSDVYSLGIVMYEVLTGKHPFAGSSKASQFAKLLSDPIPHMRDVRPDLPDALDAVIQKVTSKRPEQRYPSALAFARAFRQAVAGMSESDKQSIPQPAQRSAIHTPVKLPAYLDAEAEVVSQVVERPIFVARERELERLNGFLDYTMAGKGMVAFVSGGSGKGKTALLEEFSRRAMENHPNLLVAGGSCNAYSGVGDSFLPFREVMSMLTGDVEAQWAAGRVSTGQARRTWEVLPVAIKALLDHGPHLPGIFINRKMLISRASSAMAENEAWLKELRVELDSQQAQADGLEQTHIFEQYTNVLRALANEHPLLLVLDDIQWADMASVGLLFHLGRRLEGAPILILCAYRPAEIDLRQTSPQGGSEHNERHLLEKLLTEFKRQFGDVWVDLGDFDDSEGRDFIDAFLDCEPNHLGEDFRQALFSHTAGHPLFTVELLRAMQERGDLVRSDNHWEQGGTLDWSQLPAKVEGVIEERIGRLDEDLREMLTIASIEGINFTPRIVASIQDTSERQLLRLLSRDLESRHRLVKEQDGITIGRRWLARYRFTHALVHQHLYGQVSQGELRWLHTTIGEILEELYEDRLEEIAVQLVLHFDGDPERVRRYARMAGDQAMERFANQEALKYFSKAIELTPLDDNLDRYELLLAREAVYNLLGDRNAQKGDLEELQRLVNVLSETEPNPGEAALAARWATFTGDTDYRGASQLAEKAVSLAKQEDKLDVALEAYIVWAHVLRIRGELQDAANQAQEGVNLARGIGDAYGESRLLNMRGLIALEQRDFSAAKEYFEHSLAIAQKISDRHCEARPLNNLGNLMGSQGDYQAAQNFYKRALKIANEIGNRRGEGMVLVNLGWIASVQGDYATAIDVNRQSQAIARQIGDRYQEAYAAINLCSSKLAQGEYVPALEYADEGFRLCQEIGDQSGEAWALTFMGQIFFEMNNLEKATRSFQESLDIRRNLDQPNLSTEPLAGLARVSLAHQDISTANEHVDEILSHLDQGGNFDGTERPLQVWQTCYQVLEYADDSGADSVLSSAYKELQSRANRIGDEDLRCKYLENIPYHAGIVKAWQEHFGDQSTQGD